MGDARFDATYERLKEASDPASEMRTLSESELVAALAALAAGQDRRGRQAYLANVLATETMNRIERKSAIVESSADGLMHVDERAHITYLNPAGEAMSAFSLEDLRGHTLHDMFQPQDGDGRLIDPEECPIMETMRTGVPTRRLDMTFLRKDGSRYPVEYSAAPVTRDGEMIGATVVFVDRTAQHRALHALLRSEERYDRIVESIEEYAIFMLDASGRIVSWNSGAKRITRLEEDDAVGAHYAALFVPDDVARGAPQRALARAADEGRAADDGWRVRKDGSRFWASVVLTALYDDQGHLRGFVNVTKDLTDRVRLEDALERRARMQGTVSELGLRALDGADLDALAAQACRLAAEALGCDLAILMELLPDGGAFRLRAGHGWRDGFVRPESRLRARPDSVAGFALRTGAPVVIQDLRTETRFPPPSHLHDHQVRSGMAVVVKDGGPAFGVLAVYAREPRAFTEDEVHFVQSMANTLQLAIHRQAAEDAHRKLNELLESRVAGRTRELRIANESLESFAYVVSHDLKEPVRALMAYLHAAQEEYGKPEGRAHLEQALRANEHLASLLQGLLAWSRIGIENVQASSIDVRDTIFGADCAVQWENLVRERGARIDVAPELPRICATPTLACQVFGNLIVNAIKHNPRASPTVRVFAADADAEGAVEMVVKDDGPGFPEAVLQRFDRLREHRPSTVRGGFGLALARRAMERLGGRMWLVNTPEGGEAHLLFPPAPPQG